MKPSRTPLGKRLRVQDTAMKRPPGYRSYRGYSGDDLRGWVHYQLNDAELAFGDHPILGPFIWFAFVQWQRVM